MADADGALRGGRTPLRWVGPLPGLGPADPFAAMALLRLGAAGLIALLALARPAFAGRPPAHLLSVALALAAAVAASALAQLRRPASPAAARAAVVVDAVVASGLLLASAADPGARHLFSGLAVPVLAEAVIVLGFGGGLAVWALTSAVEVALEVSVGTGGGGQPGQPPGSSW